MPRRGAGRAGVASGRLLGMEAGEFVRRLKPGEGEGDRQFALFLGAGCSVSSKIPTAADLVRNRWLPRLRDLKAPARQDLEQWAQETLPGYSPSNPGASYG